MPDRSAVPAMRVLFISRAFPPVVGGIEQQNYEISRALHGPCDITVIANRYGKRMLPLFFPYALLKALVSARRHDVILLGDGVLAPVGYLLRRLTGKPAACIIHGLDLTFRNRVYQRFWTGYFIPRMDRLIAVGNETIRRGTSLGISAQLFRFIPNGVAGPAAAPASGRGDLEQFVGRPLPGPVILTLGRLVKRKGVAWFVEHVIPVLDSSVVYIIAGTGRDEPAIRAAIARSGVSGRVLFLGSVTEAQKRLLFETADMFVQPNIAVPGDIEGFGMVVLEAAAYGLPVLAARLEGLQDAITDGRNGVLVTSGDADAYRAVIADWCEHPDQRRAFGSRARDFVLEHCSWSAVAEQYRSALENIR